MSTARVPVGNWHKIAQTKRNSLVCLDATIPLITISSEAGNITPYKRDTPLYLASGGILDQLMPNCGDQATIQDFYGAYYPHLDADRQRALKDWATDDQQYTELSAIVNRWPAYLERLGFIKKTSKRGSPGIYERTALTLAQILATQQTDTPEKAWARKRIADLKAELSILERFLAG